MTVKIKWGVIGCGGIAYRRTIPGMMLSKNSELVAVMDTDFAAAQRVKDEFGAKYAFSNEDELLALDEIDAVYIATPVFCHKRQAIMAADAKKHILLEKPMGLTVAESEEISEYCKKQGVKLGVGLMMRFSSYHQKMKEIIEDGLLGNIVSMRAQLTCMYPEIPDNWRQDKARSGGGALMDMGIHCIDLLQYITGTKAESVCGFVQNQTFTYNAEDCAAVLLKMNNGATAFIDTNFNIPDNAARCRIELYGTCGSILAEGTIGQVESGEMLLYTEDKNNGYDANQNRQGSSFKKIEPKCGNMYEKEITAFSDAVINDTEPIIGADDAIFVQKTVEAAYTAQAFGKYIKL